MNVIRGISTANLSIALAVSDLAPHLRGTMRAVLTFAPVKRDGSASMHFTHRQVATLMGVGERQVSKSLKSLIEGGVLIERRERVHAGQRREDVRYISAEWLLSCASKLIDSDEDYLCEAGERIKAYSGVVALDSLDAPRSEAVEEDVTPEPEAPTASLQPEPTVTIPAPVLTAFGATGKGNVLSSLTEQDAANLAYAVEQVGTSDDDIAAYLQDAIAKAGTSQGTVKPRPAHLALWVARRMKEMLIDADLRPLLTAVERDALVTARGTDEIDQVNQRAHALKAQGVDLASTLTAGRRASTTSADTYKEGPAAWFLHWGFKNAARTNVPVTPQVEESAPQEIDPRLAALIVNN